MPAEPTYELQWSNWTTENNNGIATPEIYLEDKNYILVQEQAGYGIVDIGFGIDGKNYFRSNNNYNGRMIEKPFRG